MVDHTVDRDCRHDTIYRRTSMNAKNYLVPTSTWNPALRNMVLAQRELVALFLRGQKQVGEHLAEMRVKHC